MFRELMRERWRAKAINELGVLDRRAEPGLDRFVEQAADAFAAPIALLTILYRDDMRAQASAGLALKCLPRDQSFCTHAVDGPDVLEVCDATLDPRFKDLAPVLGEPRIRYYIGSPLRVDGRTNVGVLCIIDTRPRPPLPISART